MPVPCLPRRADAVPVLDPYFQTDRAERAPALRRLAVLEQMFAYWGSDRG